LIHKSIALGMFYTHVEHFYIEPKALKPTLVKSLHYAGHSTVIKPKLSKVACKVGEPWVNRLTLLDGVPIVTKQLLGPY
jgi:hypothetical protein